MIIGDIITFGEYRWRVLDVKDGKALILSDIVIETGAYNNTKIAVTWETCDLRKYLNDDFYNRFDGNEKSRITLTTIQNKANPWFGTDGGNDTTDRIFLLSIEEAVKYFGDSGQLKNRNPKSKLFINDQYKSVRKAANSNGETAWWWLRSSGLRNNAAAQVYNGGSIHISGHYVNNDLGGIRPVLWLSV